MKRILLCAPIHEKEEVFKLYLKHIRKLTIPRDIHLDKLFILHNCESLKEHIEGEEKCIVYNNTNEYKKDEQTHYWEQNNFNDVVFMKNKLIEIMLQGKYDYIFYVDSDLMLHPNTLVDLYNADKDMISEIFWTKWNKNGKDEEMPNCWHYDHYGIFKHDLDRWRTEKSYFKVGMTGACTLIKRKVLEAGVNWLAIPNVSMSVWEDRAFCIKATVAGFEIWTSTNYPALHLYRKSFVDKFIKEGGSYE